MFHWLLCPLCGRAAYALCLFSRAFTVLTCAHERSVELALGRSERRKQRRGMRAH